MENDLMLIIESLEKDKGIDKEIILKAILSSIETVARKTLSLNEDADLKVEINKKGQIQILENSVPIRVESLGRIAAQTAKQVIMQKVREAEANVLFKIYKDKKGSLINGVIQKFERGSVFLNIGKTMAVLPRSEQVFRDDYQLNDRLRAYIMDVKASKSDVQLIVSRASIELIRNLFEFEIPEISEGLLEIKGIVREAGDRTKIAIHSTVPKLDSVGACVGMRGCRVKSIVTELRGEKVDILRWSENPDVFIRNVLNSKDISSLKLNHNDQSCEVLVPEDKLSFIIGKKGQNVRLAVKLTGWDINISSDSIDKSKIFNNLFKDAQDTEDSEENTSLENFSKSVNQDKQDIFYENQIKDDNKKISDQDNENVQHEHEIKKLSSIDMIDENIATLLCKSKLITFDAILNESLEKIAMIIGSDIEKAQSIIHAIQNEGKKDHESL